MSNAVLNDERLSFRARGVLMWLLSKPADWRTRSESIAAQSPKEGREAVRTAMRELEEYGYLVREKIQDPCTGHWSTIQTVYEEPITDGDRHVDPKPKNPVHGDADTGNLGAVPSTDRQRIETNHHHSREVSTSPAAKDEKAGVVVSTDTHEERDRVDQRVEELRNACQNAGLTATWGNIKAGHKAEISELVTTHGIPEMVAYAQKMHRELGRTRYATGWIPLWKAMPVPQPRATPAPKCSICEGTGFVIGPDDLAIRCECRNGGDR